MCARVKEKEESVSGNVKRVTEIKADSQIT